MIPLDCTQRIDIDSILTDYRIKIFPDGSVQMTDRWAELEGKKHIHYASGEEKKQILRLLNYNEGLAQWNQ